MNPNNQKKSTPSGHPVRPRKPPCKRCGYVCTAQPPPGCLLPEEFSYFEKEAAEWQAPPTKLIGSSDGCGDMLHHVVLKGGAARIGRPIIHLHRDTSPSSPVLASVARREDDGIVITVPDPTGRNLHPPTTTLLTRREEGRRVDFYFTLKLELPEDGFPRTQAFQWTRSTAREMLPHGFDELCGPGWRLLKIALRAGVMDETVAACALPSAKTRDLQQKLDFRFVRKGKGAMLGETWRLMALMSGLTVWHLHTTGQAQSLTWIKYLATPKQQPKSRCTLL